LKKFSALASTTMDPTFVVKTRLLESDKSAQKEITKYVNQNKPKLLVLGSKSTTSNSSEKSCGSVPLYCQRHCKCPVVIVKRTYRGLGQQSKNLALAVDTNIMSDRAFEWLLKSCNLPASSFMMLVHAVEKATDKPDARKFLSAFGSRCRSSQKKHLIQSALLWFRDRTPEQAVDRFCELRAVDTLVLASNGNPTWTDKIKVTTSDYCVNYVSGVDIIIWRDPNPTPAPNTQFPEWDFSVAADSDQFPVITEHDLPRSGESRRPSLNTITRTLEKGTDRRHSTVDANLRALRPSTDSTKPSSSRRHSLDNGDMMRPNPPPCPRPAEKNNTPLSRERTLDKKKKYKNSNSK